MKNICLLLMFFGAFSFSGFSQSQSDRAWLSNYGIDPANSCPVFTRPFHTGPARKEGAGICTNDGLAYNRKGYELSEEWHYEPKLSLCQQEQEAMPRITGMDVREMLKYGVNLLPNGGALVAYRMHTERPARHYFATYDREGNLIDAIALGTRETMNNVLCAEPHGDYETFVNSGGSNISIDAEMNITFSRYYYYSPSGAKEREKWCDTVVWRVADDGRFVPVRRAESGKPAVNEAAERIMMLSMLPLSTPDVVKQWNDLAKQCLGNDKLEVLFLPKVASLFMSRPHDFMSWTASHKKQSVLIGALRKSLDTVQDIHSFRKTIYNAISTCPDTPAKNYWQKLKEF